MGRSKYWFKPKSHGYGATPNTWEGWVATAAATLAPGALAWILLGGQAASSSSAPLIVWIAVTIAIFVGFYRLARQKTDGEWRWRWKGETAANQAIQETLGKR